jgi:hypothetical protein
MAPRNTFQNVRYPKIHPTHGAPTKGWKTSPARPRKAEEEERHDEGRGHVGVEEGRDGVEDSDEVWIDVCLAGVRVVEGAVLGAEARRYVVPGVQQEPSVVRRIGVGALARIGELVDVLHGIGRKLLRRTRIGWQDAIRIVFGMNRNSATRDDASETTHGIRAAAKPDQDRASLQLQIVEFRG